MTPVPTTLVLMTPVPAEGNAAKPGVFRRTTPDQRPGVVFGTVIHEEDPAVGVDLTLFCQRPQLGQKFRRRQRKHFFLVVAGDHDK